jgi:hypothetical protein
VYAGWARTLLFLTGLVVALDIVVVALSIRGHSPDSYGYILALATPICAILGLRWRNLGCLSFFLCANFILTVFSLAFVIVEFTVMPEEQQCLCDDTCRRKLVPTPPAPTWCMDIGAAHGFVIGSAAVAVFSLLLHAAAIWISWKFLSEGRDFFINELDEGFSANVASEGTSYYAQPADDFAAMYDQEPAGSGSGFRRSEL